MYTHIITCICDSAWENRPFHNFYDIKLLVSANSLLFTAYNGGSIASIGRTIAKIQVEMLHYFMNFGNGKMQFYCVDCVLRTVPSHV